VPKTDAGVAGPVAAAAPGTPAAVAPATPAAVAALTLTLPPGVAGAPPLLAFAEAVYEANTGQELEIRLVGSNLTGITSVPIEILFNPQLLGFVRGERGTANAQSFKAEADDARGVLKVDLAYGAGAAPADTAVLARLILRGNKPGISYLVYRTPALKSATGESLNAQVRASRVVIK
jgi:hypothetical protein